MSNPFRKASEINEKPFFFQKSSRQKTTITTLEGASSTAIRSKKKKKKKKGTNNGKNILSFFKPKALSNSSSSKRDNNHNIDEKKQNKQTMFVINTNVVGCQFHQKGLTYFKSNKSSECILLREPTNRFDTNAILVVINRGTLDLGHVPRTESKYLSILLDYNNNSNHSMKITASIPIENMGADDFTKYSFPLKITVNIPLYAQNDLLIKAPMENMKKSILSLNKRLQKKVNIRNAKKNRQVGPQQQSLHQFTSNHNNSNITKPTIKSSKVFESIPDALLRYIYLSDDFTLRDFVSCKLVCKRWLAVITDNNYLKFFFAYFLSNVKPERNIHIGMEFLNLVYNDRNHYFNSNGKKDDNNNVSSGSDTSTIYQLNSISWENGIPTDIEQLFKFVIHKFSKLVRFSKSDVLKMFSGISIFQDCEYLVKLAIDGLTALTAVVIYGEPEIVHYLLSFIFNHKYHYMAYNNDFKCFHSVARIIQNFGRTNSLKYEWIYSILLVFRNPYDINHKMKYNDEEPHILSGNESWTDRGEIILSSLRTANAIRYNINKNKRHNEDTKAKRTLTGEQQNIIWAKVRSNDTIAVNAFAGTGKTTTLVKFAAMRPSKKLLYLVFNVSIRTEAAKLFPANTDVKSFHALAYSKCGFRYANKLKQELKVNMVMAKNSVLQLKKESQTPTVYKAIVETIENYCNSADTTLSLSHIPSYAVNRGEILNASVRFFNEMKSRDSDVPMTHAGYLKLYAMSYPRLDDIYDIIMVDEAQDINPVIHGIIVGQKNAGKVIVGDCHQSIYSFSGSHNTLQSIAATQTFSLTQCFRFGWKISSIANVLLRNFTSERKRIAGMNNYNNKSTLSFWLPDHENWHIWDEMERKHPFKDKTVVRYTIVARTNQTLWHIALDFLEKKIPFIFIGGVKSYNLQRCIDIAKFIGGDNKVKHGNKFLAMFKTPNDFHTFAMETGDSELLRCWNICLQYGSDEVINRFESIIIQSEDNEKRNILNHHLVGLGTVHKVKGLEFDCVLLANDFIDLRDPESIIGIRSEQRGVIDEFNMLYVAITRARIHLRISYLLHAYLVATSRSYMHTRYSIYNDKNDKLTKIFHNKVAFNKDIPSKASNIICAYCERKCMWSMTDDDVLLKNANIRKCNIVSHVSCPIFNIDKGRCWCVNCSKNNEAMNDFMNGMCWLYMESDIYNLKTVR